jgi:mannosyltransferase OCH1-like enzyme
MDNIVRMRIPPHIYQIGLNQTVHSHAWQRFNPTYSYTLLGDADCQREVDSLQDARLSKAYASLLVGASRADVCRLVVLWKHGGVYCDTDVVPYRPLNFPSNASFVASEYYSFEFILSVPNHPFVGAALNASISNIEKERALCRSRKTCCRGPHHCIIQVTGPISYFRSIAQFSRQQGCGNRNWVPKKCTSSSDELLRSIHVCRDTGQRWNPYRTTFCGVARHADCRNSGIGTQCKQSHYKNSKSFFKI